jgi:hypothetical protein
MSQAATERVSLRLTEDERERFEEYVEESDKYHTLSQLFRDAALAEVNG